MKSIVYLGNFAFPYGNAAGKRVYANGKILQELGFRVIFIGLSEKVNSNDTLIGTKDTYDEFEYYNLPYPQKNIDWLKYKITFNKVRDFLEGNKKDLDIKYLIYYGSPTLSIFNTKIIKYCRKNRINIIADCVDWLTPNSTNKAYNLIKALDNIYQKAWANKKCDGVIAISKFLEEYYKKSKMKTVILPPLSPFKFDKLDLEENARVSISYAGIPFKLNSKKVDPSKMKDRIDKIVEIFVLVKEKNDCFILNIYGFNKEEYLKAIPEHSCYIEFLADNIKFHGHLNHAEVIESIRKTDFTVLIRDIKRDSMAGFPTKISESISCGIPVITNKSSDIDSYIIEGENGYFINQNELDESSSKIVNILNTSQIQINKMKQECIKKNLFYYKNYTVIVKEFLKKI